MPDIDRLEAAIADFDLHADDEFIDPRRSLRWQITDAA
jgi:hypothetical protein